MTSFENDQHIPIDDLSAFADGEMLSGEERTRIEAHLAQCESCREELDSLRAVSALLSELPEPELPRSFRLSPQDVASASAQSPAPEPEPIMPWIVRKQATFRVAAMAAALLLALIVTIDLLPGDTDESTDEAADAPVTMMEESAPESAEEAEPESGTMDAEDDVAVDEQDEEAADEDAVMEQDEEAALETDEDTAMDQDEEAVEEDAADAPESETDGQVESEEDGDIADAPQPEGDEQAPAEEEDGDAGTDGVESEDDAALDGETERDESAEPFAASESEDRAEQEPSPEMTGADAAKEGASTLRIIAVVLAILTLLLVIVGFVLPRMWTSSAR
jgi:hypothetical protein